MFLNVLFKYTFEQQRTESYLACLDVWNVCVDYVQGLISSRVPEADVIVPKYRGLFNVYTVKLGNKKRFDKEQIGIKEPFPVTNLPFAS